MYHMGTIKIATPHVVVMTEFDSPVLDEMDLFTRVEIASIRLTGHLESTAFGLETMCDDPTLLIA